MILAFILVVAEGITLQRPEKFLWRIAPQAIRTMLLEKTTLGQISEAQDILWEKIVIFAGEELVDRDPSPPRTVEKKGKSDSDHLEAPWKENGADYPKGHPRDLADRFEAE